MQGWVKLHRKLIKNPIMQKPELLQLFIYCLLKANHEPSKIIFNGNEMEVGTGQFITGRDVLAGDLKQNGRTLYDRLKVLQNLEIINIKSNNRFTLVTVVNYGLYQLGNDESNSKPNNKPTTSQQQTNTYKNDKNDKNDKTSIYSDTEKEILNFWNSKNIIQHGEIKEIKKAIKNCKFNKEQIITAINNYSTVYHDKNYFYSHKWRLDKFLKQSNGIRDFLNDGQQWINYQSRSVKNGNYQQGNPEHDEYSKIRFDL